MLKQFVLVSSLLATATAFSGEAVLIGSKTIEAKQKCLSSRPGLKFGLNNAGDVATVEVSIEDNCSSRDEDGTPSFDFSVANPEALSLDSEGVAGLAGKGVECAYKKKFIQSYMKATGDCKISLGYKAFSARDASYNVRDYVQVSVYVQAK
jgi:hypothetical protein